MFCFTKVKGIIFDLDDTLVHTNLDFAKLKSLINCKKEDDILGFIERLECDEKRREASKIVLEHELEEARTSQLIAGADAFIDAAKKHKLPLAIVTRNCREATQLKLKHNPIDINLVLTREDAPPKPNPEALLNIAKQWRLPATDIAYIGDYKYDIQAAHNANMQAWLYTYQPHVDAYLKCLTFIPKPKK